MTTQWIRRVGLTLTSGGQALDLSQMHIKFSTTQMDMDGGYPPGANIRVYNLKDDTVKQIQKEYTEVTLQAGYVNGEYGVIFKGTVKLIRVGRLNTTDSFVDIMAADGDQFTKYGIANISLKSGWKSPDVAKAIGQAAAKYGTKVNVEGLGTSANATGGIVTGLRGKTGWGLASTQLQDVATSNYGTYSIINGEWKFTSLKGYQAGEAVVLNSNTGLIGVPESTIEGILVTCLLNPKLQLGGRIKINNKDINTTTIKAPGYPQFGSAPFYASVTADGIYRIVVLEYIGDTRGQEWYANITALSLDGSADLVNPYGYSGVPAAGSSDPGQGGIGHA